VEQPDHSQAISTALEQAIADNSPNVTVPTQALVAMMMVVREGIDFTSMIAARTHSMTATLTVERAQVLTRDRKALALELLPQAAGHVIAGITKAGYLEHSFEPDGLKMKLNATVFVLEPTLGRRIVEKFKRRGVDGQNQAAQVG
jgi:hypothetical protein